MASKLFEILKIFKWFATTLVYYGLAFGAGSLSGSVLHNNAYNALVEIVAQTIIPFLVDRKIVGRRYGTIITMSIGFLSCFGGTYNQGSKSEKQRSGLGERNHLGLLALFACLTPLDPFEF